MIDRPPRHCHHREPLSPSRLGLGSPEARYSGVRASPYMLPGARKSSHSSANQQVSSGGRRGAQSSTARSVLHLGDRQAVVERSETEERCAMSSKDNMGTRIAELTCRLAAVDHERAATIANLAELKRQQATRQSGPERPLQAPARPAVTMDSSTAEKIALFRSLFRGREDVLRRRWDNPKTENQVIPPRATMSGFQAPAASRRSNVANARTRLSRQSRRQCVFRRRPRRRSAR